MKHLRLNLSAISPGICEICKQNIKQNELYFAPSVGEHKPEDTFFHKKCVPADNRSNPSKQGLK